MKSELSLSEELLRPDTHGAGAEGGAVVDAQADGVAARWRLAVQERTRRADMLG